MLSDLEQLIVTVRTDSAREYISEAVKAYQAGAYRASIVATWIAVVFDIIDKLRDLELAGDANARKQIQAFEHAQKSSDYSSALKFERSILDLARVDFEFLSLQEYEDLRRLHDDRNRCAHPSMALEGIYQPSAELARYHIKNAVSHLLSQPPVQGQAALNRLVLEVESEYFPTQPEQAVSHFQSGPLSKPRTSLIRNFAIVLSKRLLEDGHYAKRHHFKTALKAVHELHPAATEKACAEKLSHLVRAQPDSRLRTVVWFLSDHPFSWRCLETDMQLRLQTYVENIPDSDVYWLEQAFRVEALRVPAAKRLRQIPLKGIAEMFDNPFWEPSEEFLDRAIMLLNASRSYDDTNTLALALALRDHVHLLTEKHVEAIAEAVEKNGQVSDAFRIATLLEAIQSQGALANGVFDTIATRHALCARFPTLAPRPS